MTVSIILKALERVDKVYRDLLTAVSHAQISNTGSCNNEVILLLLLLQTLLMLKLLLANVMPLLLFEK